MRCGFVSSDYQCLHRSMDRLNVNEFDTPNTVNNKTFFFTPTVLVYLYIFMDIFAMVQ